MGPVHDTCYTCGLGTVPVHSVSRDLIIAVCREGIGHARVLRVDKRPVNGIGEARTGFNSLTARTPGSYEGGVGSL